MRTGRSAAALLAIMVLICFAFASTALAATPKLTGTWTGGGKTADVEGYELWSGTLKITDQSDTLFRGTLAIGTKSYGVSGCISGNKVFMTVYDKTKKDVEAYFQATLGSSNVFMKGVTQDLETSAGYFSFSKKK